MMHAAIRHDVGVGWTAEQTVRTGRALTTALRQVPGFIFCTLLDTGSGDLTSICVCEDRASLDDAYRLLADWLTTHLAAAPSNQPLVITGKVIVQAGL